MTISIIIDSPEKLRILRVVKCTKKITKIYMYKGDRFADVEVITALQAYHLGQDIANLKNKYDESKN